MGLCPLPRKFSLLTLEKAHFGGYLIHFDVLLLKLWFDVHRMLQGCATDSVSLSPTNCSSWGPLAPDKLRPRLSPFYSHAGLPSLSFSYLAKLSRCSYAAASSL